MRDRKRWLEACPLINYSLRKSPTPLRTVPMPVVTEAIAPQVCVSAETGRCRTPIAKATFAIESTEPRAIWTTPLQPAPRFVWHLGLWFFHLYSLSEFLLRLI